jgi:hypothetical protein
MSSDINSDGSKGKERCMAAIGFNQRMTFRLTARDKARSDAAGRAGRGLVDSFVKGNPRRLSKLERKADFAPTRALTPKYRQNNKAKKKFAQNAFLSDKFI